MSLYQPLPTYNPMAQTSGLKPIPVNQWASVMNYEALAKGADAERLAMSARDVARQKAVIGGYDQQMLNSRAAGNQAYQTLAGNYDAIVSDAEATRARNMGRIDQYGNSMRRDLDVKSQQSMAAANQSAIQRGLGNTTILNSLQRGAAFDNTRQKLTLEDQLLQNRISTDSSLSSAYQGAMSNRAGALNNQANQNIGNDNQLAGNRLGYIGGIQENMDGFNTVANLYSQQLQMQNANEQAELDRLQALKLRGPTPAYTSTYVQSAMQKPERIKRGWT